MKPRQELMLTFYKYFSDPKIYSRFDSEIVGFYRNIQENLLIFNIVITLMTLWAQVQVIIESQYPRISQRAEFLFHESPR